MTPTPDPSFGERGSVERRAMATPPGALAAEAQDEGLPNRPRRRTGRRIKVAQTLPTRTGDDPVPDEHAC